MKNILYLMHVPWGWIKQRPHFIAEELSKTYNLTIAFEKSYKYSHLSINESNVNIIELNRFPFRRFELIRYINNIFVSLQIESICNKTKYDLIWITDIRLYDYLNRLDKSLFKIVYDCMDDTLEFKHLKKNTKKRKRLIIAEKELVKYSDFIICSSLTLKERLQERTDNTKNNVLVVNNALDDSGTEAIEIPNDHKFYQYYKKYNDAGYIIITYVGTISDWFDFDSVLESLNAHDKIIYFIIGPNEIDIPVNERIVYIEPIEHIYVKDVLNKSDILIMPFHMNRLVEAVDPVKIYEYISSARPIIAKAYPEMRKFKKYVNLYNTTEDYCQAIDNILKNINLNNVERSDVFIKENTWKNRVQSIIKCLN